MLGIKLRKYRVKKLPSASGNPKYQLYAPQERWCLFFWESWWLAASTDKQEVEDLVNKLNQGEYEYE